MTPAERRLLADINRWRREEGWVTAAFAGYRSPDRRAKVYIPDRDDAAECEDWGRHVSAYRRPAHVRVRLDVDHDAASVTEAVDVLCALGILPAAKFSSAYRAGWADGETAGLLRAAEFEHTRQVALTAMAVLTPDAPEVT